jgi:hypothetical protein
LATDKSGKQITIKVTTTSSFTYKQTTVIEKVVEKDSVCQTKRNSR